MAGSQPESWADWAMAWANVYSGERGEFETAGQVTAEVDTRLQISWISRQKPTMRILYDDSIYDIHRIEELGRCERWNVFAKGRVE